MGAWALVIRSAWKGAGGPLRPAGVSEGWPGGPSHARVAGIPRIPGAAATAPAPGHPCPSPPAKGTKLPAGQPLPPPVRVPGTGYWGGGGVSIAPHPHPTPGRPDSVPIWGGDRSRPGGHFPLARDPGHRPLSVGSLRPALALLVPCRLPPRGSLLRFCAVGGGVNVTDLLACCCPLVLDTTQDRPFSPQPPGAPGNGNLAIPGTGGRL